MLRNHRLAMHPQEVADATKFHRCAKCNAGFNTEAELLYHQENHAGSQHCNGGPPAKKARGRPPKADGSANAEEKQVKRKKKGEAEEGKEDAPSAQKQAKPRKKKTAEAEDGKTTETADQPEQAETGDAAVATGKAESSPRRGRPPKAASSAKAEEKKAAQKKAHPCGECEESFARPEQLQAHVSRVHTAGRHSCPTCGKSFGRESNLKAHQRTHTEGEEGDEEDKG